MRIVTWNCCRGDTALKINAAMRLRPDVLLADIVDVLRPVLERFADLADPDTNFGDWADDVGVEAMQPWLPEAKTRRGRRVAS